MIFGIIENKILGGFCQLKSKYETSGAVLKRIYQFVHKAYQYEMGCYLPLGIGLSGPINFPHGTAGIFISGSAKIGRNCTIYQQVTIGSNALIDSKKFGSPLIGDNCLIGAGAKIIGRIVIGDNCRIGANCVITENVPENSTVVLGKPIIINKDIQINKLYSKSSSGWSYMEDGIIKTELDPEIIRKLDMNS